MRDYRILIFAFIVACKAPSSVTQQSSTYYEDLSVHRVKTESTSIVQPEKSIAPATSIEDIQGHILNELDSVNKIIVAENTTKQWDGFRIQVYTGNSRQRAQEILSALKNTYPEYESSMTYYQPSYRVKIGYFFDRLEASKVYSQMKEVYPRAMLLPEKLSLPKVDDE